MESIRILNEFAIAPLKIDATILMKLDIEEGFKRTRVRYGAKEVFDRFESQNLDFHKNVMSGFLQIAEHEKDRVAVIDASGSIGDIHKRIMEALNELLR
jgi:dTMP kinase